MRIADIGKREEQRAQDGAGFGFEAKLVDDVLGGAVLVIIDVDGVKDFVVEIEIVRSVPRLLSRVNVGNEHYFAWVSQLRNAYVSILSAAGSRAISGASLWLA